MVPTRPQRLVCIAAVAAAHGVRGGMRLRCFTAEPESVAAYGPVHDEAGNELFSLELMGRAKGGVIARARGITSREAAEALRGKRLYVPRERLPEPDADEFYHEDLVGLAAVSPDGAPAGHVSAVYDFGAGDLIEITAEDGQKVVLPFTREIVPEIDLGGRRLVVELPAEPDARGERA